MQACQGTSRSPDSLVMSTACGTGEEKVSCQTPGMEGQAVGAGLPGNSQIATCLLPLGAMRIETAAGMTAAGQKMGKFVKQGPLHLLRGDLAQAGIQPDLVPAQNRDSGRCPHAWIPSRHDELSQSRIYREKDLADLFLQQGIPFARALRQAA